MVLLEAVQAAHVVQFFVLNCFLDHVDECCDLEMVLEELVVHQGLEVFHDGRDKYLWFLNISEIPPITFVDHFLNF